MGIIGSGYTGRTCVERLVNLNKRMKLYDRFQTGKQSGSKPVGKT
jgi:hypothetical protein